jgi:hypothetical protein
MKTGWIVPALLLLGSGNAWGRDIYCAGSHTLHLIEGAELQKIWRVVNSTVRRVQLPGRTKPSTGCSYSWNSVGGLYRPIEIVQRPKLGQARITRNYRINYSSAKNGEDEMMVRIYFIPKGTTRQATLTVHYHITVTDQPI